MSPADFRSLKCGDIVQSRFDSTGYIVTANYGDRATAVTSVDMTNPTEWDLIQKANHQPPHTHYDPYPKEGVGKFCRECGIQL
jgi:hypothetical protein